MAASLWTSDEARGSTGGRCDVAWTASGVSIDSRTVVPGDLFIALEGPHNDGHRHVASALKDGAAAAMVARNPDGVSPDAPLLIVSDTLAGLNALGTTSRRRSGAQIIAVTGSVGKTGTKEALLVALASLGETHASALSYNNHWGVPLSLARMPKSAKFGVFEVGMNHGGEITPLSRMIRPDVSIITTIEPAHLEFFASVEEIADAKAEIFAGMQGGVAVLNRDNEYFSRLAAAADAAGVERVLSFGEHEDADIRMISSACDLAGSNVEAELEGRRISYRLGLPGHHHIMNSLAVLGAVAALGCDVDSAARALATLSPLDGRGARHVVKGSDGAFTVIDESYNANPASVRAAIELLAGTTPQAGGRRIAALGDMRELGSRSAALHDALAKILIDQGIDLVFGCGPEMTAMMKHLPESLRGDVADNSTVLARLVTDAIRPGDVIVVKGSNASAMKTVVTALLESGAGGQRAGLVQ
jgi:UDP-N-acetylmuramoyl-tripeptide--D-alanyl-D-alanine ligase